MGMPVQKQTSAGQRTRFKCVVAVGDYNGHIGMGTKCAKEVATAIRGGINAGKCGAVRIRLVPAARGTGIVASPTSKKVLQMAGISDCYTASQGHTKTRGNFAKAAFDALGK